MESQVLIESTVSKDVKNPLLSRENESIGYAVVSDVNFGTEANAAEAGTLRSVPYVYELVGSAAVEAAVVGTAGNTLTIG